MDSASALSTASVLLLSATAIDQSTTVSSHQHLKHSRITRRRLPLAARRHNTRVICICERLDNAHRHVTCTRTANIRRMTILPYSRCMCCEFFTLYRSDQTLRSVSTQVRDPTATVTRFAAITWTGIKNCSYSRVGTQSQRNMISRCTFSIQICIFMMIYSYILCYVNLPTNWDAFQYFLETAYTKIGRIYCCFVLLFIYMYISNSLQHDSVQIVCVYESQKDSVLFRVLGISRNCV